MSWIPYLLPLTLPFPKVFRVQNWHCVGTNKTNWHSRWLVMYLGVILQLNWKILPNKYKKQLIFRLSAQHAFQQQCLYENFVSIYNIRESRVCTTIEYILNTFIKICKRLMFSAIFSKLLCNNPKYKIYKCWRNIFHVT